MLGFDADGNYLYGGDQSILVDRGCKFYVGHDTASGEKDIGCRTGESILLKIC